MTAKSLVALNARQLRFVDEYLIDLNATQAAIRAGYSPRTAGVIAAENLQKPNIAAAVAQKQAERAKETKLSAEYIITRLQENVERAMQAEPVMKFDHEEKRMIETGEYQYEGSVANRALELLGKHIGLFPDRHEVTGKNGESLAITVVRT